MDELGKWVMDEKGTAREEKVRSRQGRELDGALLGKERKLQQLRLSVQDKVESGCESILGP